MREREVRVSIDRALEALAGKSIRLAGAQTELLTPAEHLFVRADAACRLLPSPGLLSGRECDL